jgi:outer membrane receptor protein involved in Fe transport
LKKILLFIPAFGFSFYSFSQGNDPRIITGNIMDEKKKALDGATVLLKPFDSLQKSKGTQTDKNGNFIIRQIAFGWHRIEISSVGFRKLLIDSFYFRKERFDFNLTDIILKKADGAMEEVIIYSEKPLIQSKDGNITFNAGESALAAGSTAGELLNNVPLVTKDPSGKILVRGKEPKILIDDKPVELNLQQLQDLLESLPGSSIEKIEVMTNPPPQYANEQGGVINITTRKSKVGMGGRISISGGTRGEAGVNGNFSYRKKGFALNINAGAGYNRFEGNGYSIRQNLYTDSSNYFRTKSNSVNKSIRPNLRINLDYDIGTRQSINFVLHYNQNNFRNRSVTGYKNINRFDEIYRLSERTIQSEGDNYNPNLNFTYTLKGKTAGESLKIITGANFSSNNSDRNFYQQFFNPDYSPNGLDTTQQQLSDTRNNGYSVRLNYDKMLLNKKTFLSLGGYINRSSSHVEVDAGYLKKPDGYFEKMSLLSNDFKFHQTISNLRASVKQVLRENFSVTAGLSAEVTDISFELLKDNRKAKNNYYTFLPFANINRTWKEILNLTLAYRRTIRRPGINELNPAIDFGDPYNVRFGNPELEASASDNFDLVLGRTKPQYYINLGLGFNNVKDIFSQVRTLLSDGKTQITWENISGRKEYELSTWSGYSISKKIKLNLSASYNYNVYSAFDKTVNRYRNGGSFTSNLNGNYTPEDVWNFTGSFTFNRFANPQGYVKWNTSMNMGLQRKFFEKKFVITLNIIDPFIQQENRSFTYGSNFNHESFSTTQTKNYRLTLAYSFTKTAKKPISKAKN